MKNFLVLAKKIGLYLLGLLIIALGINVSKMCALGISPVSSIPRALEVISGEKISLGTMVIVVYCLLVLAQFIVLGRDFKLKNTLGVPVAIIFGWMVDLVGINPNASLHLLYNFPRPQVYVMKLVYLIASIILIAIGVYIYLKPKLVAMPAEGLAAAIAQKTNKSFGDCKTLVDVSLILIALILQIIFLGGFSSFTAQNVVVREGTIISAFCVGQVVKLITKFFTKRSDT